VCSVLSSQRDPLTTFYFPIPNPRRILFFSMRPEYTLSINILIMQHILCLHLILRGYYASHKDASCAPCSLRNAIHSLLFIFRFQILDPFSFFTYFLNTPFPQIYLLCISYTVLSLSYGVVMQVIRTHRVLRALFATRSTHYFLFSDSKS